MSVAVISKAGKTLMPTSEYRARRLLKSGRAEKHSYRPFAIRLTEREDGDVQLVELCMDTGYEHIGVSVKSGKHEYLALQTDTLKDETSRHKKRAMYRRQRRNRMRYRAPRFNNRKVRENWIAPSLEHRKNIHLDMINRTCRVMPVTDITLEMGNFDTQLLKALEEGKPVPKGKDYQQGERYKIATLREAVFSRDGYTCQCCKKSVKDGVILRVHHVRYRSQGGSDKMSNLVTVCNECHTSPNHKPGGKLWGWKPKLSSFKGATYMTTIRWMLYNKVKSLHPDINIHITYGAETKLKRRRLDIRKSHINDAYVMGMFQPSHRTGEKHIRKKRRNNRVLEKFYDVRYIDGRDGQKKSGQQLFCGRTNRNHNTDTENLHKYRKQKVSPGRRTIRKNHYQFQPHDIVIYNGQKFETSGCHCNGTRVVLLPDKKSVVIKKLQIFRYAGGYYTME